jgi:hypothetical protein
MECGRLVEVAVSTGAVASKKGCGPEVAVEEGGGLVGWSVGGMGGGDREVSGATVGRKVLFLTAAAMRLLRAGAALVTVGLAVVSGGTTVGRKARSTERPRTATTTARSSTVEGFIAETSLMT